MLSRSSSSFLVPYDRNGRYPIWSRIFRKFMPTQVSRERPSRRTGEESLISVAEIESDPELAP